MSYDLYTGQVGGFHADINPVFLSGFCYGHGVEMGGRKDASHYRVAEIRPWRSALWALLVVSAVGFALSVLFLGEVRWDSLLAGLLASSLTAALVVRAIYPSCREVVESAARYRRLIENGNTAVAILDGRERRCLVASDVSENRLDIEALTLHERAMEASSVGILIVDASAVDMPLIYVNPAFERITGYSSAEALGRNCRFLQGTDRDQPGLDDIRSALREEREGGALLRNYRKDGTRFWNELAITPVHGSAGKLTHYIGISRDVSERMSAEAALRRYEFMVNAVGESMSVVGRNHRYEAVNDRWCLMLGRERSAVIGKRLEEIWGDEVCERIIAPRIEECFREDRTVSVMSTFDFPDKGPRECAISYYPYHAQSGEVSHVVVLTRDITEQVLAERALQDSETRLRAILDNVVDGIVVIDERGVVESFNPAAERIFGYPPGKVVGNNVSMLMTQPDRGAHDGYIHHYFETGESRVIGTGREVTGLRRNGRTFPMEVAVSAISSGRQCRFVGVVRDISERKRADLELSRALEAAQAANRAKSEFLSRMSHELRTPLNAILGFSQLLELDPSLGEDQRDGVLEILKAGHHLLALIDEVLDLSRIESGKLALRMEPVALGGLIKECLALVEAGVASHGLTLTWDTGQWESRWARADRLRLKQVLINLLSNAVKYNRQGGDIRLACVQSGRDRLRLSVTDTGLGIGENQQSELFTAFHRLGREHGNIEGTGIGLAICKRLAEMMGGDIGVESRLGVGSRFWVDLPESAPPESAAKESGVSRET